MRHLSNLCVFTLHSLCNIVKIKLFPELPLRSIKFFTFIHMYLVYVTAVRRLKTNIRFIFVLNILILLRDLLNYNIIDM